MIRVMVVLSGIPLIPVFLTRLNSHYSLKYVAHQLITVNYDSDDSEQFSEIFVPKFLLTI